jgi:hypothetical protein
MFLRVEFVTELISRRYFAISNAGDICIMLYREFKDFFSLDIHVRSNVDIKDYQSMHGGYLFQFYRANGVCKCVQAVNR